MIYKPTLKDGESFFGINGLQEFKVLQQHHYSKFYNKWLDAAKKAYKVYSVRLDPLWRVVKGKEKCKMISKI